MYWKVFFLTITVLTTILVGCATTNSGDNQAIVCQGDNLYIPARYIEEAPNYNSKLSRSTYGVTADVLQQAQLEKNFDLKSWRDHRLSKSASGKYKGYYLLRDGCDKKDSLYLVQVDKNGEMIILKAGNPFLSDFQPSVVDTTAQANEQLTIDGIRLNPWIIQAYHDADSSHAKYLGKKRVKLSWDLPYPVVKVVQYSKSNNHQPFSPDFVAGDDYVFLDLVDGYYVQLMVQYPTGVQFFYDDGETDYNNLALVRNYKKNPEKVLEIIPPADFKPLVKQIPVISQPVSSPVTPPAKKRHYTKREKYPDGWYYVETAMMYQEDSGFFTHLSNDRDIVSKTEDDHKIIKNEFVLVGAKYLEKWSPDIYAKYKDKDRFVDKPTSFAVYPDKK